MEAVREGDHIGNQYDALVNALTPGELQLARGASSAKLLSYLAWLATYLCT